MLHFDQRPCIKINGKPPFVNEIKPSFVQKLPRIRTAAFNTKILGIVGQFFVVKNFGIFAFLQNENSRNFFGKKNLEVALFRKKNPGILCPEKAFNRKFY